jgi:hypothetical protein
VCELPQLFPHPNSCVWWTLSHSCGLSCFIAQIAFYLIPFGPRLSIHPAVINNENKPNIKVGCSISMRIDCITKDGITCEPPPLFPHSLRVHVGVGIVSSEAKSETKGDQMLRHLHWHRELHFDFAETVCQTVLSLSLSLSATHTHSLTHSHSHSHSHLRSCVLFLHTCALTGPSKVGSIARTSVARASFCSIFVLYVYVRLDEVQASSPIQSDAEMPFDFRFNHS